jgi:hypothetical protein
MEIIKRAAADAEISDLTPTPETILNGIVNLEIRAIAKQAYHDFSHDIFVTIDHYAFGKDSVSILYRATVSEKEITIEFEAEGNAEAIAFEAMSSEIVRRETKPHIISSESIDTDCSVTVIDDPSSLRFENLLSCKYGFIRNGKYFLGDDLGSKEYNSLAHQKDYDMVINKFVHPDRFGVQLAKTLVVLGNNSDQQKAHNNFALANAFNRQLKAKLNGGDFTGPPITALPVAP